MLVFLRETGWYQSPRQRSTRGRLFRVKWKLNLATGDICGAVRTQWLGDHGKVQ
jgi:hypothetical protein